MGRKSTTSCCLSYQHLPNPLRSTQEPRGVGDRGDVGYMEFKRATRDARFSEGPGRELMTSEA